MANERELQQTKEQMDSMAEYARELKAARLRGDVDAMNKWEEAISGLFNAIEERRSTYISEALSAADRISDFANKWDPANWDPQSKEFFEHEGRQRGFGSGEEYVDWLREMAGLPRRKG